MELVSQLIQERTLVSGTDENGFNNMYNLETAKSSV